MNRPAAAIECRGVSRTFDGGRIRALDGMDLLVEKGEFIAIVGPSGCGKSTLLHAVAALDRPDAGTIAVNGRNLADEHNLSRFRAREIGIVFQLDNLLPALTASENVQLPMFETEHSGRRRRGRALELLTRLGIAEKADQRPPELSGGERQRVAIARALANRPAIVLADEPTGRLDSVSGARLLDLLEELHHREGLTVVLVTHDAAVAARADRIIRMLDGRIVADERVTHAATPPAAAGAGG